MEAAGGKFSDAGLLSGRSSQVTVAYLSPLVLRKELESLLENEGEAVLAQPQFLENHSIIYWNLVWYFQRLGLPSNLLQLVRASALVSQFTQSESSAVRVRLLWDTLTPDTDQWPPPLHPLEDPQWRPNEKLQLAETQPPVHPVLPGGGAAVGRHERGAQSRHPLPGHAGQTAGLGLDAEEFVQRVPLPHAGSYGQRSRRCVR
ncbi:DENN domain-containing protein 4B-like [Sparus aurata]|uniref:DENN domain-containing protein 4B-like n=1 Tax=Sparus aurata TaxID=8175 RepID=UPI0011C13E5B|nr:DENN domain-containing protein 4B-like [Sparus aurata]